MGIWQWIIFFSLFDWTGLRTRKKVANWKSLSFQQSKQGCKARTTQWSSWEHWLRWELVAVQPRGKSAGVRAVMGLDEFESWTPGAWRREKHRITESASGKDWGKRRELPRQRGHSRPPLLGGRHPDPFAPPAPPPRAGLVWSLFLGKQRKRVEGVKARNDRCPLRPCALKWYDSLTSALSCDSGRLGKGRLCSSWPNVLFKREEVIPWILRVGVAVVAQLKWIWRASTRTQVPSVASIGGLTIQPCREL